MRPEWLALFYSLSLSCSSSGGGEYQRSGVGASSASLPWLPEDCQETGGHPRPAGATAPSGISHRTSHTHNQFDAHTENDTPMTTHMHETKHKHTCTNYKGSSREFVSRDGFIWNVDLFHFHFVVSGSKYSWFCLKVLITLFTIRQGEYSQRIRLHVAKPCGYFESSLSLKGLRSAMLKGTIAVTDKLRPESPKVDGYNPDRRVLRCSRSRWSCCSSRAAENSGREAGNCLHTVCLPVYLLQLAPWYTHTHT